MATMPTKAAAKAVTLSPVQARSAKVAPATSTDSPSAMMTKRPDRSARCAPATSQSVVGDRPMPGTRNPAAGPAYSMAIATSHSAKRISRPIVSPPAIQNADETTSQTPIRQKLRKLAGLAPRSDQSMKPVRESCMNT